MKKKKTKGVRRASATMYPLIRAWEMSGQSQYTFSKSRGLSPGVFGYWLRKYREDQLPWGGFVAVGAGSGEEVVESDSLSAKNSGEVFARLRFGDGRELIICQAVSSDYLRSLLG